MLLVRAIPAVCSAALLICFVSAQAVPATNATPAPVVLGDVAASQQGNAVEVRIPAHGVTPYKMLMKDPDRIVLDFRGAQFGSGNQRVAVNQSGVLQIRASQFQVDPPVARVVIDLSKPVPSRLETVGDEVVMRLGAASAETPKPPVQAATKAPVAKEPAKTEPAASRPVSSQNAVVEGLSVHPAKGELAVSVKLSQTVTPKMWSEREPDRIVMDFPGTLPGNTSRRITVGDGSVQTVRLSLYQENPPVTRIVFDVAAGTRKPQLEPNGNELTVKFQTGGATSSTQVAAAAPKPESKPAATVASKPSADVHRPVLQSVSHPPPIAHIATAQHVAPEPAPKEAAQHPAATDMFGPHPPNIRFANGLLSIEADNSVLTDILYEVGSKTGAEIQMPPWSDAGRERVVANLGPGNPRDVIAALLHGSSFNYVIVESPQGLQQLILTPKTDWPGPQGGQANQPNPQNDQPPVAAAPIDTPPADVTPPPPDNPQF
jgi:hypothetical protein